MKYLYYLFIKLIYIYIVFLPLIMLFYPHSWQFSEIGEVVGEDIIQTQYQVGNSKYFAYEFKYKDSNGIVWSMNQPRNDYSTYTFTYPFSPIEKYQIDSLCNHAKPVEYRTWIHIVLLFVSACLIIISLVCLDCCYDDIIRWNPFTIHEDIIIIYKEIFRCIKTFFGY